MADTNTGGWVRFENSGQVLIGTEPVLNLVPGSVRVRRRQRERVPNRDRGVLTGVTVGDQRPQEIEFQIYRTSSSTGSEAAIALMLPASTNGMETFFTLVIRIPDYLGAATGESHTFNRCYLADGVDDEMSGAGQDADKITIRVIHYGDIVTPATY
jgi:hypothetical protein